MESSNARYIIRKSQELISKIDACPPGQHFHEKGPAYARECHPDEIHHRESELNGPSGGRGESRFCQECHNDLIKINGKQIKMVSFDMDGTLTHENSFMWIYDRLGLDPNKDSVWDAYVSGKPINGKHVSSYGEAISGLSNAMKNAKMTKQDISSIFQGATISEDLPQTVKYFQDKGVRCNIVSCGMQELAERLNNHVSSVNGRGFDDVMCVRSSYDSNGHFTGMYPEVEYKNKGLAIQQLQKKYGISPSETISVGDSVIDGDMFRHSVMGILYNSSPKVLDGIINKYGNLKIMAVQRGGFGTIPDLVCRNVC